MNGRKNIQPFYTRKSDVVHTTSMGPKNENIQVFLRMRPFIESERQASDKSEFD